MMRQEQATVYLGLGSNLGDRCRNLWRAVEMLQRVSAMYVDLEDGIASLYETSPVGGPLGQARYLNTALRLFTELAPLEVLEAVLAVERSMGRTRGERWASRNIDLDVLLVDDCIVNDAALQLPHPRLHLRRFVLEPLRNIAPTVRHPVLHKTVTQLADEARQRETEQQVERVGDDQWFRGYADRFTDPCQLGREESARAEARESSRNG